MDRMNDGGKGGERGDRAITEKRIKVLRTVLTTSNAVILCEMACQSPSLKRVRNSNHLLKSVFCSSRKKCSGSFSNLPLPTPSPIPLSPSL